jgi:uncharacterized protein (TIGR02145 family)
MILVKKNFWIYLFIAFIAFVANSCKKEDAENNTASTIKDIDGNVYHTVIIGSQVWMAENLEVAHYRNGDTIPSPNDSAQWSYRTTGAYCRYNVFRDPSTINDKLYNWFTVNDSRKIAPEGWHVPNDSDWNVLITYLGGETVTGGKLKEIGTSHWASPNTDASNTSGFTALPDGLLNYYGKFTAMGSYGYWWSTTAYDTQEANYQSVNYSNGTITRNHFYKTYGLSVRCIKD